MVYYFVFGDWGKLYKEVPFPLDFEGWIGVCLDKGKWMGRRERKTMKKKGLPGQGERTKGMESWKIPWLRKIFKIQQIILFQNSYLILIWTVDPQGAVTILYIIDIPVCVEVCICLLLGSYFLLFILFFEKCYVFIWAKMRTCSWEQDLKCSPYLLLNMLSPTITLGHKREHTSPHSWGLFLMQWGLIQNPASLFTVSCPLIRLRKRVEDVSMVFGGQTPLCH